MSAAYPNPMVESAFRGDEKAFAGLVESHYAMVHGVIFAKVHDWGIAEDLAQEAFLIAWNNLKRLRHAEAFSIWMRQIARHAALNWLRREQYRKAVVDRHAQHNGFDVANEEDPSGAAARSECLERVGEAMRSLSPKLREAMVLFYLEGMTATAGADALGIGVDTMKKRLRLGRKGLQRYFEKHVDGELDQLLPHRSKRRVDQIVAGLALGPVMPDLGAAIAHAGPAMWLGDLRHGASPWLLQEKLAVYVGVPFATAKNVIAAGLIVLAAGSAATVLAIDPRDEAKAPVVVTGAIGDPLFVFTDLTQDDVLDDAPAIDGMDPVPVERVLVVENLGSAAGSGLRVGDKIVKVNGHPISTSVIENPRGYIYGPAGTMITVTVRRDDGGGPETELELKIPALRAGGPTT